MVPSICTARQSLIRIVTIGRDRGPRADDADAGGRRFPRGVWRRAPLRVVVESSTESEWVAQCLERCGHEVVVADPNYALMYGHRGRHIKTDRRDVAALAEANRRGLYRAVHRVSAAQRQRRRTLRIREQLVRTRTQLINLLRAQLRQEGYRLPSGAAEAAVARYHRLSVPEALTTTLAPVLTVLEGLAPVLDAADAEATAAAAADPVVTRLMTVPGVGPITALTFRAALDDVTRFADAKAAPCLGVVPRKTAPGAAGDRGRLPRSGRGASGPCSCKARGRSGDSAAGAPRYTRGSSNSRRGAGDGSRSSPSPVDSRASSLRCGGTARRIGRRCPSKSRHTDRSGSECASRGEHR